jgi:two-component system, OmpR family, response regulator
MADAEHMNRDPKILVVDDDREIRTMLSDYLAKNGFSATAVADGQETRRALEQAQYDLIVLDLMLPHESGLEICRELRAHSEIPIIMLTALGEEVDRVVGLEMGADDYLAKPFSPRELLGRIRAVLRRTLGAQKPSDVQNIREYRFSGWTLLLEERVLRAADGETIELTGAEFGLLSILLGRAPQVVTRTDLMRDLRGREHDPFDRSIDVQVSRLRQRLARSADAPQIIKTVYGEGYVVGVPVEAH